MFERGRALATSVVGGFRPIRQSDAMADFQNSESELVRHLREDAWRNETLSWGRTFVLAGGLLGGTPSVRGYYSLAMGALSKDANFPKPQQAGLLYDKIPVAFLTHLGRDRRTQRGLGELLVQDCCRRVVRLARDIGCLGVALYALNKNPKLVAYYASYEFAQLPAKNPGQLMFLALSDILINMPTD